MADLDEKALDRLRRQVEKAHANHKTMFVYVDDLRAALAALPKGEPMPEWRRVGLNRAGMATDPFPYAAPERNPDEL